MKKIIYFLSTLIFFFILSVNVEADRGDLLYNVESVTVNNSGITINGYAFIHRTQNYHTIYKKFANGSVSDTEIVASDGGQTTRILIANCDYIGDSSCSSDSNNYTWVDYSKNGTGTLDYNFYAKQFAPYDEYDGDFSVDRYNDFEKQSCSENEGTQCYYEDIGFSITISIEDLNQFADGEHLYFYIAAFNNDYGSFTAYRELAISSSVTGFSDYFDLSGMTLRGEVSFIAGEARWRKSSEERIADEFFGCTRPLNSDSSFGNMSWCGDDFYSRVENSKYYLFDDGVTLLKFSTNVGAYGSHFLDYTHAPGMYGFCVYTASEHDEYRQDGCKTVDDNGFCTQCDSGAEVVYAYSSWIEINGNQLVVTKKNPNLCEVTDPHAGNGTLECNSNKNYSSTCEKLSVETSSGYVDVMMTETGNVSSVLTPDSIYAGGGFNFGIMYYNTVKWSYVDGKDISDELHEEINDIMNDKIKDYDTYVAGINITNLKLGGKSFNLVKQCTTSNTNKDYYNKELSVSCLFTFPKSEMDMMGNVDYNYDVSILNINNKYYTPMNYNGIYNISASIVGMDRITESSARDDSKDNTAWTGNWSDNFNCSINVYSLFMNTKGVYKFIYRPIELNNPFPNRNAGINWYDWYNIGRNVERLNNTYSNKAQYVVTLDNKAISDIKNYNKDDNYLDWYSIDEVTKESSFITENNYIVRGGN